MLFSWLCIREVASLDKVFFIIHNKAEIGKLNIYKYSIAT